MSGYRKIAALGIFLVFSIAEFRPLLPYLDYYLNYKYISEVLCVNKDKPMSCCNGKCYLDKQLNKAGERDKPDKAFPELTWRRHPMIFHSMEKPLFGNEGIRQKVSFNTYFFVIKEVCLSPPTPPP